MCINAMKNNKFQELIQDDGLAILDTGLSFGGGNLGYYGINSNTSANSFLKCILRKTSYAPFEKTNPLPSENKKVIGKDKKKTVETSQLICNTSLKLNEAKKILKQKEDS